MAMNRKQVINQGEENKINEINNENINNKIETENKYNRHLKNQKSMSSSILRPYRKQRTFKDIFGYDNITSFKSNGEKYLYSINSMKKNNFNGDDEYRPTRRYDGFTVTEAPVIQRNRPNSASFDYFNNRINQTLNCLNKRGEGIKAMNEEEMKQNLFNQTSSAFLKKHHLPDVVKMADARQVIRRQKIGLSKEMGERYNPYSLIAPSKNRTGRNYVGDLFKH